MRHQYVLNVCGIPKIKLSAIKLAHSSRTSLCFPMQFSVWPIIRTIPAFIWQDWGKSWPVYFGWHIYIRDHISYIMKVQHSCTTESEVLKAVTMNSIVFRTILLFSFKDVHQSFGGTYCLHHFQAQYCLPSASSSEMFVSFYRTTCCHIPEDSTLHQWCGVHVNCVDADNTLKNDENLLLWFHDTSHIGRSSGQIIRLPLPSTQS
jgi:hypothetical protein